MFDLLFPQRLQFPLTIVLIHFIMKFVAAGLCRLTFTLYTGIKRVSLGEINSEQDRVTVSQCHSVIVS